MENLKQEQAAAKVIAGMENEAAGDILDELVGTFYGAAHDISGMFALEEPVPVNRIEAGIEAVIPLIQADVIRRMMEPGEEMLDAAHHVLAGEEGELSEVLQAMLRTFAQQTGIKL